MPKIYKNNFGEIDKEEITLFIENKKQRILLKNIIKIRFIKRQKYHVNYTILLVSVYLLFIIKNNNLSELNQLLLLTLAILLIITSFYIKLFQYKFILIKKNDFISIEVTKKLIKDAENLANRIEEKIAI